MQNWFTPPSVSTGENSSLKIIANPAIHQDMDSFDQRAVSMYIVDDLEEQ
jgi:hypothetical protein